MNSTHFRYMGYATTIQYDSASEMWHGRIADIQDVVSFEGSSLNQAESEFQRAVEGYLSFCHALGRSPNSPV